MEISGVDFVTVPTRDFERADEFYGNVLGLRRSKRWGDRPAGEFETGTLTIAVMQSDAFGIEFQAHTHPIALHVAAMIAVMAVVAVVVYEHVGVAVLRKAWVNLDGVWAGAFVVAGLLTLFT